MNVKKNIQIFYGGFKFVKGGVNSHSHSLKNELQKRFRVSLYTLDSLPLLFRFVPHIVEKVINIFSLPLGFYYKGIITGYFFKMFFNTKTDYRIFEDIYIPWNSNVPSITMLHAIWSDNLQKFEISKKKLDKLKKKEKNRIDNINHPICTVSRPYKDFILKRHFLNKIKKKINVVELGIEKKFIGNISKSKSKSKSLIYVGSLEHRKNIFFLIDVFYKLYNYDSDYQLTIVGEGQQKNELIKYSKKLKLKINFLGSKNTQDILSELKKHEIYIHTSIKESFSLSLLEAKISGLITVAYKKLEVPKNFIDIAINNFNINNWFNRIIKRKKKYSKFNKNKYLLTKTAQKILSLSQ